MDGTYGVLPKVLMEGQGFSQRQCFWLGMVVDVVDVAGGALVRGADWWVNRR